MPRKAILWTATSVDGFIARADGTLDWVINEGDPGYRKFYDEVDALLVGRGACERIMAAGPWPYADKPTYVFSRRTGARFPQGLTTVRRDPTRFVAQHKVLPGRHLWILGGCVLNSLLLQAGLIDHLVLLVYPAFFGAGIPLFDARQNHRFRLAASEALPSGVLHLRYDVPK
ncbi:MAG: dihydrofolate reductase [Verrucomicrobia bacterium]|nr:dihydrofolate reductase [Verrucomicrobiota bacterium]